jgi:hypothetical protein
MDMGLDGGEYDNVAGEPALVDNRQSAALKQAMGEISSEALLAQMIADNRPEAFTRGSPAATQLAAWLEDKDKIRQQAMTPENIDAAVRALKKLRQFDEGMEASLLLELNVAAEALRKQLEPTKPATLVVQGIMPREPIEPRERPTEAAAATPVSPGRG